MSSHQEETSHPLRCYCSRRPLLATYGVEASGRLYVHVKVYKQHRIYGNIKIYGGEVKIQCRECIRWYAVAFRENSRQRISLTEIDSISTPEDGDSAKDHGGPHPSRPAKVGTRDD